MKIDNMKNIKSITLKIKEHIHKNPIAFYKYSMIILGVLFVFNAWREIYYPPNYFGTGVIGFPSILSKSDKKIEIIKRKTKDNLDETKKILDELEELGRKRKDKTLTNKDSIRAKYLMKKYNEINNGGFEKN